MSREKILPAGFLLLGILCLIALWRPEFFGLGLGGAQSGVSVGEVRKRDGDVRRKGTGEIAWHDLMDMQVKVADGDTVFTGPTGNAELNLDIGAQAIIFPNSMVVIHGNVLPEDENSSWLKRLGRFFHRKREGSRIALQSGSLHIDGLSREHPIEVESNGSRYRLETVSAKASADLTASRVNENQPGGLSLSGVPGSDLRLIPIGPIGPIGPKVSDTQAASRAAESGSHLVAAVSPIEAKQEVKQEPMQEPIQEKGAIAAAPELSSIILEPVRASTRIFDEEHFDYIPVNIKWKAVPGASGLKNYHVRIFHGDQAILEQDVAKTGFQFKLTDLDPHPYYYQVSAVFESGVELTSAKTNIDIDLAPPQVTLPEAAEAIHRSADFVIAWERTLLTKNYRIQIARDPEFKTLKLDRETDMNVLPFRSRERGSLYVRVKSLSQQSETPWSASREVQIH